jgi:hypothetical protein
VVERCVAHVSGFKKFLVTFFERC